MDSLNSALTEGAAKGLCIYTEIQDFGKTEQIYGRQINTSQSWHQGATQKSWRFSLSPERAAIYQPRASPWGNNSFALALKGRYKRVQHKKVALYLIRLCFS